jgi:hypothetical protein
MRCAYCDEDYEPDDRDHAPEYCSLECEDAAVEDADPSSPTRPHP